jgi:hypothetical protein
MESAPAVSAGNHHAEMGAQSVAKSLSAAILTTTPTTLKSSGTRIG